MHHTIDNGHRRPSTPEEIAEKERLHWEMLQADYE